MAVKALAVDESGTPHVVIGLNRDNIDSLLSGDVFTLPPGNLGGLREKSDIVILFAETDDELTSRLPPLSRPS